MSTPGGWTAPQYALPLGGSGDGGPAGIGAFASWTQTEWNTWLNARFAEWLEQYGIPLEYLNDIASALVLAFQGEPGPLEELIEDAVRDIPVVGDMLADLKDAFEGTYTGTDPALLAIQSVVSTLRALAGGRINLSQLGKIPLSLLTAGNGNELVSGLFGSEGTINDPTGRWVWDASVGRTQPGCARTVGDGTEARLNSELRAVDEGEVIDLAVWVKWSGLVASLGAAGMRLDVRTFAGDTVVGTSTVVAGFPDEFGLWLSSTEERVAAADGDGWVELAGEFTVPAGVDGVRVQLAVTADMASGTTVWWDDGSFTRTRQSLPQQWIAGLADALGDLGDWIESLVNQLLGALGVPAIGTLFDKIADLSDEVEGWLGDTQDRAADLANLISGLLSAPDDWLGNLSMGKITGLAGELADKASTTVVAAVQTFILDLANAILSAIRKVPVVGGTIADRIEDVVDDLGGLKDQADGTKAGIVAGWTGGSTSGADADVYDTMAAVRSLVGGDGYTRVSVTSSQSWTPPAGTTEVIVVGIAAGSNGESGTTGSVGSNGSGGNGGNGGQGGGHKVQALNMADFSSLYIEVGTNGAATRFRANSSSGTILAEAFVGSGGSMATQFGYTSSGSQAGGGGGGAACAKSATGSGTNGTPGSGIGGGANGGTGSQAAGGAGGGSAAAAGGTSSGGAGGSVPIGAIPCGGGGGAGGRSGANGIGGATPTAGGAGGFPGGGGGGGAGGGAGGFTNQAGSAGGSGGAGYGLIYYR